MSENKHELSSQGLHRLVLKSGIARASADTFNTINKDIQSYIDKLASVIYTIIRSRHKTVTEDDVVEALRFMNVKIGERELGDMGLCEMRNKSGTKKTNHFKPGKLAILEKMERIQRQSNCFQIQNAPVERMVRSIMKKYSNNIRFTPDAIGLIHAAIETRVVNVCSHAKKILHFKRVSTLNSEAYLLATNICE